MTIENKAGFLKNVRKEKWANVVYWMLLYTFVFMIGQRVLEIPFDPEPPEQCPEIEEKRAPENNQIQDDEPCHDRLFPSLWLRSGLMNSTLSCVPGKVKSFLFENVLANGKTYAIVNGAKKQAKSVRSTAERKRRWRSRTDRKFCGRWCI